MVSNFDPVWADLNVVFLNHRLIIAGALQGYYGGWLDLLGQRFIESLVWYADLIFTDNHGERGAASVLVAAIDHVIIQLDEFGWVGAGGILARPQF